MRKILWPQPSHHHLAMLPKVRSYTQLFLQHILEDKFQHLDVAHLTAILQLQYPLTHQFPILFLRHCKTEIGKEFIIHNS